MEIRINLGESIKNTEINNELISKTAKEEIEKIEIPLESSNGCFKISLSSVRLLAFIGEVYFHVSINGKEVINGVTGETLKDDERINIKINEIIKQAIRTWGEWLKRVKNISDIIEIK